MRQSERVSVLLGEKTLFRKNDMRPSPNDVKTWSELGSRSGMDDDSCCGVFREETERLL